MRLNQTTAINYTCAPFHHVPLIRGPTWGFINFLTSPPPDTMSSKRLIRSQMSCGTWRRSSGSDAVSLRCVVSFPLLSFLRHVAQQENASEVRPHARRGSSFSRDDLYGSRRPLLASLTTLISLHGSKGPRKRTHAATTEGLL